MAEALAAIEWSLPTFFVPMVQAGEQTGRIEQGATITEAFRKSRHLLQHEQALIESGELSGTLERSFERLAVDAAEKLRFRLGISQQIFTRIMASFVVFSIATTLLSLLLMG